MEVMNISLYNQFYNADFRLHEFVAWSGVRHPAKSEV